MPSRLEYLSCRLLAADTGRSAPAEAVNFYHAAGWDEQAIERYMEKFGSFGEMVYPWPAAFRRLEDGETFLLGSHQWSVVMGKGHSPEHARLYSADLAEPQRAVDVFGSLFARPITSESRGMAMGETLAELPLFIEHW